MPASHVGIFTEMKAVLAIIAKIILRNAFRTTPASAVSRRGAEGGAFSLATTGNQQRALDAFAELLGNPLTELDRAQGWSELRASDVVPAICDAVAFCRRQRTRTSSASETARLFRVSLESALGLRGWSRFFSAVRPDIVIMSNDHTPFHRTVAHAAQNAGTKTAYVQHASVTTRFPSLRCFDVAFLDGPQAECIYREKSNGRTLFVRTGAVRNAALHSLRESRQRKNAVGIAMSARFEDGRLRKLLDALTADTRGYRIILRPHPRRHPVIDLARYDCVEMDRSAGVEEFISSIDALICGSTSTAMEAVAGGVPCLYFQMEADGHRDYYGYHRNGVLPEFQNASDLWGAIDGGEEFMATQLRAVSYYDDACIGGVVWMKARIHEYFENLTPQRGLVTD